MLSDPEGHHLASSGDPLGARTRVHPVYALWHVAPPRRDRTSRRGNYGSGVIDRKDLGSWMDGAPTEEGYVKGSSLGLPVQGTGSVAPFWRRPLSLVVDWGLCLLVSALVFSGDPLANLILFVVVNVLFLSLFGATPGQFALRLRVMPVSGRSPMILRAAVRTALMLLLLPAVVWNRDSQPLHDVAAGTAVVTV